MTQNDERSAVEVPRRFARPWLRSERPIPRKVVRPVERFVREEAGSGSLLLAAALIALAWINVDADTYEDLWTTEVSITLGSLSLSEDLRHLVNDLLMAVFFYVVALEVKREILFGSLRERSTAAIPVAAALGTMVGGAAVYIAVNIDGGTLRGWAVPIATDIAFALAVLGVAGRRAPAELRAFMLTLAVVDDVGTIAVIALFFAEGISVAWLAGAIAVVAVIVSAQRIGIRQILFYVIAAGALWVALFESGVHATIAGVVLGFLTPAVAFHRRDDSGAVIGGQLAEIERDADSEVNEATMRDVSRLANEAVSPLARMEEVLHPWSAYAILPLFALANAGVEVSLDQLGDAVTSQVGLGIILGLVVGAPVVGIAAAWATTRLTPSRLPDGLDWPAIAGVAPLKGIGFTVAIFIAVLAFDSPDAVQQAKLAILIGSAISAMIGFAALALRARLVDTRGDGRSSGTPG
jgi:NhaA family Na+:H+ antiporter